MEIERWMEIEGGYLASSHGRIYSHPRFVCTKDMAGQWGHRLVLAKMLSPSTDKRGYKRTNLVGENRTSLVHRIVAMAFIENPKRKATINHIDGNKSNNHISNLQWATSAENTRHSWATGLANVKKAVRCIDTGEVFESGKVAAKSRGKTAGNLVSTMKGNQVTFDGHRWEYV